MFGNNPETGEELDPNDFGGSCNLGSLFLHNFVHHPFSEHALFDYDKLHDVIYTAVKMLDNIIDINKFPSKIYENYQKGFRTIGLGVTGLADAMAMLGIRYDSQDGITFAENLMTYISATAFAASSDLARERGSFPFYEKTKFLEGGYLSKRCTRDIWDRTIRKIEKQGIRNAKILSIAPTGTLSLTFGNNCSSGIEPIFCLEYDRNVHIGGQEDKDIKSVKMEDYAYHVWKQMGSPEEYKDVFSTALEISVQDHLAMLATIAKYVDMSVSKTINVPEEYSFEQTKNIYRDAWENGIKGCTIFRPNKIRQGVLNVKTEATPSNDEFKRGEIVQCSDDLIGMKRKLRVGCGSLHVLAYFDKTSLKMREVFLSKGSTGGCANYMTGLSRMLSLLCRADVPVEIIKDQLDSTGTCPSYAVRRATKHDTSPGTCCPMAIGNALVEMQEKMRKMKKIDKTERTQISKTDATTNSASLCPECGAPLIFEGGCNSCRNCGYSKCG